MLLHPDVQKKAQAELDAVVGRNRLPGYEDAELLPYLSALVREVLRSVSCIFPPRNDDVDLGVLGGNQSRP